MSEREQSQEKIEREALVEWLESVESIAETGVERAMTDEATEYWHGEHDLAQTALRRIEIGRFDDD